MRTATHARADPVALCCLLKGGVSTRGDLSDVCVLDMMAESGPAWCRVVWSKTKRAPAGRSGHAACGIGRHMWLFGGRYAREVRSDTWRLTVVRGNVEQAAKAEAVGGAGDGDAPRRSDGVGETMREGEKAAGGDDGSGTGAAAPDSSPVVTCKWKRVRFDDVRCRTRRASDSELTLLTGARGTGRPHVDVNR